MSTFKTLHDRILVRPAKAEIEVQIEGFEVAGKDTSRPVEGVVVSVGQGRMMGGKLVPLHVKPGDKILYQGAHPVEVEHEGEELLVMSEGEVLAVLEEDD